MKNSISKILGIKQGLVALVIFLALPLISSAIEVTPIGPLVQEDNIERTDVWTEYKTFGGIKIEYKFQDCDLKESSVYKNMTVVLFRFSNLSNTKFKISWSTALYFDNECANCDKLESTENSFVLKLDAKEVVEGNCSTKNQNGGLYIAAYFNELRNGTPVLKLTNFKFVNLQTSVWK